MTRDPIMLVGGSGTVGRWAARFLREAHPDVPLLIAGRDRAKVVRAAAEIGNATSVVVNLDRPDLGIADRPASAVATLFTDQSNAVVRWAQRTGAGHVSISPAIFELGPEVAAFMDAPDAAPMVLGTEWLVGATSVPTLIFAEAFGQVREIGLGALLDEDDAFGAAAKADLERQTKTVSAAMRWRDGRWEWRGDDETPFVTAVDGTRIKADAFSPNDVLSLAMATSADDVSFDLALGTSSTRRAGGGVSTEILIDLAGEDHDGKPLRTRHAVIHRGGQMPLTGLGVALVLERLAGLVGTQPGPGLYFPSQLIDRATYLSRLHAAGGELAELDPMKEPDA